MQTGGSVSATKKNAIITSVMSKDWIFFIPNFVLAQHTLIASIAHLPYSESSLLLGNRLEIILPDITIMLHYDLMKYLHFFALIVYHTTTTIHQVGL